jgi:hypothetical protein
MALQHNTNISVASTMRELMTTRNGIYVFPLHVMSMLHYYYYIIATITDGCL